MTLYILLGIAVGVVLGYLIGLIILKKNKAVWEERLSTSKDRLEQLKRESAQSLSMERAKLDEAEQKVAQTLEDLNRARQELEEQRKQVGQLQSNQQDVESARVKAVELAEAHKMARQQAEGRCKQAEAQASQVQQQLKTMQATVQSLEAEKANLSQSAERHGREVARLRAELAAAQEGSASTPGLEESVEVFANTDGTLEGVLRVLMETEHQQAAVLADTNGIVVAAAGETSLKEGMAATSQLVGNIVKQLGGVVPFTELRSYHIQDDSSNVIAGRSFICAGEFIGLATYGPRLPSNRVMDGAMANLSAILD